MQCDKFSAALDIIVKGTDLLQVPNTALNSDSSDDQDWDNILDLDISKEHIEALKEINQMVLKNDDKNQQILGQQHVA